MDKTSSQKAAMLLAERAFSPMVRRGLPLPGVMLTTTSCACIRYLSLLPPTPRMKPAALDDGIKKSTSQPTTS